MSASRPQRPPSLFGKLPLELVERIVGLVQEQDKAFRDGTVARADPKQLNHHTDELGSTDVLEGRWSCWLGRGLVALSLVDKRARRLSFPRLIESVTLKQLDKPLFRYQLIHQPEILSALLHVDLRRSTPAIRAVTGPLLSFLSPSRLTFDAEATAFIVPPADDVTMTSTERALAAQAFRSLVKGVTSLTMQDMSVGQLEVALKALNLSVLRELRITYPHGECAHGEGLDFRRPCPPLLPLFARLTALTKLEVDYPNKVSATWSAAPEWSDGLSLPSLKELSLPAGQAVLDFVPLIAPNIFDLTLVESTQSYFAARTLPNVRRLTIFLDDIGEYIGITLPSSSSLHTLTMHHTPFHQSSCFEVFSSPEDLPPSIRLVVLHLQATCFPSDVEAFSSACADRGIRFRFHWTPDLYQIGPALSENGYDCTGYNRASFQDLAVESARESLDWAKDRLEWAVQMGDDRTVHEIVQATYRLRERQAIELQ